MARKGVKEHLFREPVPENVQDAQDCLSLAASELEAELLDVRRILKRPRLEFMSVSQEDFLIEVKIADAKKLVPDNWVKINSTKKAYRYRTPAIIRKMNELEQCKERLAAAAKDAYQSFLRVVSAEYDNLRYVVLQVGTADVLFSLASVALSEGYCLPQFVDEPGMVDITNGRHPVLEAIQTTPIVPNSIKMGGNEPRQIVLTGLNMGGKSSLSRMVALIVLMAQLGSYVPAEACRLSLFDSCFTRMGGSDDASRGRSTFMVEMSETSEILKLATSRSLILLDELGRGTSTNDGQAIASAVLETIVTKTKAVTLFVTHYPGLADIAKVSSYRSGPASLPPALSLAVDPASLVGSVSPIKLDSCTWPRTRQAEPTAFPSLCFCISSLRAWRRPRTGLTWPRWPACHRACLSRRGKRASRPRRPSTPGCSRGGESESDGFI